MKKHVLFVETESDNLLLMRRIVEHMGHRFSHTDDVSSAQKLAATSQVDLILATISSKVAGALSMVRELKHDSQLNDIPVVAVVHRQHEELKEQAFLAGCDGFLQKPADIRQIQALLAEFLTISKPALVEEEVETYVAAD